MSGTISRRGKTIVNGPGQNCAINFSITLRRESMIDPGDAFEPFAIGQMNDEWIEARPFLRLENLGDGFTLERIGGESINGFRGQRDGVATSQ